MAADGARVFAVVRHVAWGQVRGDTFKSEAEAVANFKELEGGGCAAALLGPEGEERFYYGSRNGRDLEMQRWWADVRSGAAGAEGSGAMQKLYEDGRPPPLPCLVVGAGARGRTYAEHADLKPVAVAEVSEGRRRTFAARHGISPEFQFASWEEAFVARGAHGAEVCVITTPDRDHVEPAVRACELFRGLLLEKPMAVTAEDCLRIKHACEANNTICAVCHVLKYTYANKKVQELIESGEIGEVLHISHTEPVGYYHFAHSFVRGNWHREDQSTFSLLAKCCHDIDLIASWTSGDEPARVSSFGSLQHFRKDKKPKGAEGATRCLDCPVRETCPYSATRLYLKGGSVDPTWSAALVQDIPDIENVTAALREGPYGLCAYECDNDVCDHQVVNVEFRSGATATMTMVATTERFCERETKVYGSLGELSTTDPKSVRHKDFRTGDVKKHSPEASEASGSLAGHGGADQLLADAFARAVRAGDAGLVFTGPAESYRTHMLAFHAEEARKTGRIVELAPGSA